MAAKHMSAITYFDRVIGTLTIHEDDSMTGIIRDESLTEEQRRLILENAEQLGVSITFEGASNG